MRCRGKPATRARASCSEPILARELRLPAGLRVGECPHTVFDLPTSVSLGCPGHIFHRRAGKSFQPSTPACFRAPARQDLARPPPARWSRNAGRPSDSLRARMQHGIDSHRHAHALHAHTPKPGEECPDTYVSGLLVAQFVVASHEENARQIRVPARTTARRCQPARRENLQAAECHLDHTPTNVPPPTFDLHELRQMILQLVWPADMALARCVGPYLSSLPRFLECLALPARPGSAVPTFSHELLRWICRPRYGYRG